MAAEDESLGLVVQPVQPLEVPGPHDACYDQPRVDQKMADMGPQLSMSSIISQSDDDTLQEGGLHQENAGHGNGHGQNHGSGEAGNEHGEPG